MLAHARHDPFKVAAELREIDVAVGVDQHPWHRLRTGDLPV